MWDITLNSLPSQSSKGHFILMENLLRSSKCKERSTSTARVSGIFSEGEVDQLKMGDGAAVQGKLCLGRLLGQGNFGVVPEVADKETETKRVKEGWLEALLSSFLD